jgi:hypothetical protein
MPAQQPIWPQQQQQIYRYPAGGLMMMPTSNGLVPQFHPMLEQPYARNESVNTSLQMNKDLFYFFSPRKPNVREIEI